VASKQFRAESGLAWMGGRLCPIHTPRAPRGADDVGIRRTGRRWTPNNPPRWHAQTVNETTEDDR
jgi:hypothetical protein